MQIKEGTAAVVTGAAGGMGRSVALALADRGVRVVVADVDQNEADLVAQEIRDLVATRSDRPSTSPTSRR